MNRHPSAVPVPRLETLGRDLLDTSRRQRWLAGVRPFVGILVFAVLAYMGWWWLTPIVVFLIFVAVVTVTHDVVHGSLGLGPRQTEWALFVLGAILLESGHAYRATHLQHHRVFPGPDDPEGDPARMSFWRALLHGPLFLPRLWCWSYHRLRGRPDQRAWLIAEAAWACLVPAGRNRPLSLDACPAPLHGPGSRRQLGVSPPDGSPATP